MIQNNDPAKRAMRADIDQQWIDAQAMQAEQQMRSERADDASCDAVAHAAMESVADIDMATHNTPSPKYGVLPTDVCNMNISKAGVTEYKPDTGLAATYLQHTGGYFVRLGSSVGTKDAGSQVYTYYGGVYINTSQHSARGILEGMYGEVKNMVGSSFKYSMNVVNGALYQLATSIDHTDGGRIPEADDDIIVFKNCRLNTDTMETTPHTPSEVSLSGIPHNFNYEATCPAWLKFLKEALPDEKDRMALQEISGYSLCRHYRFHELFMLLGAGRNGKGVFMRVLNAMLGNNNVSALSMKQLTEDKFALITLMGKHANISGELGDGVLKLTERLKGLSGGDMQEGEFKNGAFVSFTNYAKLIFAMNRLPKTTDHSDGWFARATIIEFNNRVDKPITDLSDRLIAEEIEGILCWAIEGLKRLNKNKRFSNHKSLEDKRKHYMDESEPVGKFVKSCCITNDGEAVVEKQALYHMFGKYFKDHGRGSKPTHGEFTSWLKDSEYGIVYKLMRVPAAFMDIWNTERKYVYSGIRLKNTADDWDVDVEYIDNYHKQVCDKDTS